MDPLPGQKISPPQGHFRESSGQTGACSSLISQTQDSECMHTFGGLPKSILGPCKPLRAKALEASPPHQVDGGFRQSSSSVIQPTRKRRSHKRRRRGQLTSRSSSSRRGRLKHRSSSRRFKSPVEQEEEELWERREPQRCPWVKDKPNKSRFLECKPGSEEGTNPTARRPPSSLPLGISRILTKEAIHVISNIHPFAFYVMFCSVINLLLALTCSAA